MNVFVKRSPFPARFTCLDHLPSDLLHYLAHFLSAADLWHLLCSSKRLFHCMTVDVVWSYFFRRDFGICMETTRGHHSKLSSSSPTATSSRHAQTDNQIQASASHSSSFSSSLASFSVPSPFYDRYRFAFNAEQNFAACKFNVSVYESFHLGAITCLRFRDNLVLTGSSDSTSCGQWTWIILYLASEVCVCRAFFSIVVCRYQEWKSCVFIG